MKKLIAISVMLALVAGAAFAQASVTAQAEFGTTVANSLYGDDAAIGGSAMENFMLGVTAEGDIGGGYMRFRGSASDAWGSMLYAWFQPNDYVRFKVGTGDGDFGAARNTGWGFNQTAKLGGSLPGAAFDNRGFSGEGIFGAESDAGINFDSTPGFYGGTGWNKFRINASFMNFVEGLTINTSLTDIGAEGVAQKGGAGVTTKDNAFLNNLHVQVVYAIPDVGEVRVSSILGDGKSAPTTPKLFASFYLTMIDGLTLDVGVAYQLGFKQPAADQEVATTYPFEIGLGATYQVNDDLSLKTRVGATVGGTFKVTGVVDDKDPTNIAFDVLAAYNLGSITGFLQGGVSMIIPDEGKTAIGWFVNPYMQFSPDAGVTFWTGLKLWGTENKNLPEKVKVSWAIPVTIQLMVN